MTYPSITLTGNILTYDILEKVSLFELHRQTAKDYGFETLDELKDTILFEWAQFKGRYQRFTERIEKASDDKKTGITRQELIIPLLTSMRYEVHFDGTSEMVNDKSYVISHRVINLDHYPIHVIGAHQSLDKRADNQKNSPHALLQEYLNLTEHVYGIVTNGLQLRLLRDSSLLTKLSYLEFDLDKMVHEELYADFVLMFLLLHHSRMPKAIGDDSIIDEYHTTGLESGARIRSNLSKAVEKAILELGDQLLKEPENNELREWVIAQGAQQYYGLMLKLIYRILFIMVIEERDLIFCEPDKDDKDEVKKYLKNKVKYEKGYSIHRLRKLSENRFLMLGRQHDIWENLKNTFQLFENKGYGQKIGIAPLGGELFHRSTLSILYSSQIVNSTLLNVINWLHQFETPQGQTIAINYKSLDVEEFGSVYESLLEKDPVVEPFQGNLLSFRFVSGEERAVSGSHYTPDELVQPLIKHSLEHLIQNIIHHHTYTGHEKIQALLKLKVTDIACGSGHILLAAARRIGLELARLRSNEEQPAPPMVRQGVRDAIRHCIYGVDKNPYAVELCKVALWLEAHVPGEPLSFLDSKIKCGNAILGLARFDELDQGIADEAFKKLSDSDDTDVIKDLKKRNAAGRKGWEQIKNSGADNLQKFKLRTDAYEVILSMSENTLAEVEAKQKAYSKYLGDEQYIKLRTLADLQIAPYFTQKNEENAKKLITTTEYARIISGHDSMQSLAIAHATGLSYENNWFHWFLEFPEVFAQGGFDCILGNPPFLGGQKISGAYGKNFAEYIKAYFHMSSVDLVTYFFRRIYDIIRTEGFQSLISTNTIAQGDARSNGLEVITQQLGGSINHAIRSMKWPGLAAVEVALVTIYKGHWEKECWLNGKKVKEINTYLDDQEYLGNPYKLLQNANKSFQGSIVLGQGFVLEPEEAQRLIDLDPKNKEVVFPYLNGQDLNNEIDQSPTRWVINFFDWPEEKAMEYTEPYRIIRNKVYPERQKLHEENKTNIKRKTYWWLYGSDAKNLYNSIKDMELVLVVARISKTLAFTFLNSKMVFADALIVFPFDAKKYLTFYQSTLHNVWAWNYCTTMKTDLNYSPGQTFDTFAISQIIDHNVGLNLESIGNEYFEYRKKTMSDLKLGLTKLYSYFHTSSVINGSMQVRDVYLDKHLTKTPGTISYDEAVERITHLRALHKKMDELVLEAYGWHIDSKRWGKAIDLRHDFYEVDYLPENDRIRYTIHPDARKEVLNRLLLLNHEVHESETRGISYAELDKEKTLILMQDHFQTEWCMDVTNLQPGTLRFLTMAEELWPALNKTTVRIYNAVVQHYGSALESELQEKLFIPFDTFMRTKYKGKTLTELTSKEKENRDAQVFANKLFRGQTDYTLGNIYILLSIIDDRNHPSVRQSIILQEFRDFYFSVYKRKLVQDPFLSQLKIFIDKYRNEAAHTGTIDKEGAEECKEMVKGLVRVMVESEY